MRRSARAARHRNRPALAPILLPRFQPFRMRKRREPAMEPRQGDLELPFPDLGADQPLIPVRMRNVISVSLDAFIAHTR